MTARPLPGRARRRALRRALPALLVAAAAGAAACSEIGTDPASAVSVAFDSIPAVVAGDSLRDTITGAVVGLRAAAFNGSSDTIAGAPFRFFPRDTGGALEVDSLGRFVVALKARETAASIVAALGSLQVTRTIDIVPSPDTLSPGADSVPRMTLTLPDTATKPTKNLSNSISALLQHRDGTTGALTPVRGWVVFFAIDSVPRNIADSVRLVDGAGRPITTAHTGTDGRAAVFLRVFAKATQPAGTKVDTFFVSATARYKGNSVPTSPVRFAVPVLGGGGRP